MAFKIGIVGVGRMGSNMALRLKDCGYQVTAVFDSQSELAEKVASSVGATACRHLDEVTQLAQWIVTVVTDDQAMDRIFKTSGRSLLKNAKGKIFINCATVSPATHLKVEKRARKVGARTLEACMASSITQARQGTLYLMCGGDRRTYKRVEPLLKDLEGYRVALLRNHGSLVLGETVAEAFVMHHFLEFACRGQIAALSAGYENLNFPDEEACQFAADQVANKGDNLVGGKDWPACLRMADRLYPEYRE